MTRAKGGKKTLERLKGRKGEERSWMEIQYLCGCIHSKKKKMLLVLTGQSGKREHVCVSCHNFRCNSSAEVAQGRVWYSPQLCLTAL